MVNIFLDDDLENRVTPKGFIRFVNLETLIKYMKDNSPSVHILSLDNDLGLGLMEGYEAVKEFAKEGWNVEVINAHTANSVARNHIISSVISYNKHGLTNAKVSELSALELLKEFGKE